MLASILLREQLENYSDAILEIIRNTVDYADIDTSHNKEGEQPSTNKC